MILVHEKDENTALNKTPVLSGRIFLFSPLLILIPVIFYTYTNMTGQHLNPHGDAFIYALYSIGLAAFVFVIEIIVVPMAILDTREKIGLRTSLNYVLVTVGAIYILVALGVLAFSIYDSL